jgi:uncharacterized cupin superfamily protein
MTKNILNLDDAVFERALNHGDRFEARVAPMSTKVGAKKLAYNITEVAPGKRAFPFHNHHTNEELFLILEGSGTLRLGSETHAVKKGDVIACPPGGPETAHQLINTGEGPLRYFALSTTLDTDVFQYPDSGKFGVVSGRVPGSRPLDAPFAGFYMEDTRIDYWEGE